MQLGVQDMGAQAARGLQVAVSVRLCMRGRGRTGRVLKKATSTRRMYKHFPTVLPSTHYTQVVQLDRHVGNGHAGVRVRGVHRGEDTGACHPVQP